ncbi:hypothetical protein [Lactococcus lactis]
MAKHIVEYLYYFKKSNDSDVKTIFLENLKEFEYGLQLKYSDSNGNLLYFNYNIIKYDTSLHVTFTYDTKKRMTLAEVRTFQNLLKDINIKASKSKISYSTLFDSNSLFFYKRLLPLLHKYEWSLRKLIYLLAPTYFSKDWVNSTISAEVISQIKKKIKGDFDPNNLLQMMDLYDFEEYLFGENYIKVIGEEEDVIRYKEFGIENLITTLFNGEFSISKPYSLWEEIFNQYIDIDLSEIQNDMRLIRDGRNIVGHNKEISSENYEDLSKGLKKYIKKLDLAFNKILDGNVDRNLIKESKDIFNDYMSEYFKSGDHLFNLSKPAIDPKMFESINKLSSTLSKPAIDPKMFESINKLSSTLGKPAIDPKMFESINKLSSTLSKPAIDPKMFESINKLSSTLGKPAIDPKKFEPINKLSSTLSKPAIDPKMFESINKLSSTLGKPAIDPKMFKSINKLSSTLSKPAIDPKMFESINKLSSTLGKPAIDPKMFESINKLSSTLSKPAIDPKMFESINKLSSTLGKPAIDPKMFESINNIRSTLGNDQNKEE